MNTFFSMCVCVCVRLCVPFARATFPCATFQPSTMPTKQVTSSFAFNTIRYPECIANVVLKQQKKDDWYPSF